MSGGGSPPPAPDYVGTAKQQGQSNLDALRLGAVLNRVNQSNPYSSTTYSQDASNPDKWTQSTTLSPTQQKIFNQGEQNQTDLGRIAGLRLGQLGNQGDFTLNGLPSQVTNVAPSNFNSNVNAPSVKYSDVDFSGAPQLADAKYQSNVDLSGVAKLPGIDDYSADRQRVEDSVYNQAAKYLDPQFNQREDQTRTRLLNSGITEGSEAWNNDMSQLERDRNAAYGDARDRAIQAAGAEQSRMFGDALSGRQEGVNEQFNSGNFTNSAANDANQYGLNARGQSIADILSKANFGNQATQQQFGNEMARTGLQNQTESDKYSQGLTNAQLQNEGRATGINEAVLQRDEPLREFMSLYGGGYNAPISASNPTNVGNPTPGDLQGATAAQYGANANQYNWQQAQNAQNMNNGINLATLLAMMYGS